MAMDWDPRAILDLYPDLPGFRCSGTTSRNRRCTAVTKKCRSEALLQEAASILDNLAHPNDDDPTLLAQLQRLAFCTLCPTYHKAQVDTVAWKWRAILDGIRDQGRQQESQSSRRSSIASSQLSSAQSVISDDTPSSISSSIRGNQRGNPAHAYPSPPVSDSGSPTSSASASSSNSRRIYPSIESQSFDEDDWSDDDYSSDSSSTSTSSTPPSSPSRSSVSRTISPPTPHVQVNVNVEVNIDTPRQRRLAALNTPSSGPTPPPSPPPSSARNNAQSRECRRNLRRTFERSQAERREYTSRSSRSMPGEFPRSRAPSLSTSSIEDELDEASPSSPIPGMGKYFRTLLQQYNPLSILAAALTPSPTPASTPPVLANADPNATDLLLCTVPDPLADIVPEANTAAPYFPGLPRRKPIHSATCYVCYEVIPHPEDAVWCRRGCGQNLCLLCFETWRGSQVEGGREVTCGFCRAPWTTPMS